MTPILNRSHLLNSVYFYFLYLFRPGHHHVHIEEGVGQLGLQTLDDGMAKGQVGHKMPIHDVQVEVVCSGIKQPPLEEKLSYFQIFFCSPVHRPARVFLLYVQYLAGQDAGIRTRVAATASGMLPMSYTQNFN